ncbi:MAG: hypothetical protein JSV42_12105 [Chloroflexota bacterium]|nr:MAG: hypothetical protein JSV42_12105 [Chloroflexota bacterium]
MSSKTDVIKMWHAESWENPPSSVVTANEKYLSDDYQNLDKEGNVVGNKAGMIAMSQMIFQSFTGFKGVLHDVQEEEDGSVIMTFHFEGTHTADLDLSPMGLGVVPASGKKFMTPKSKTRFTVKDGQIVSALPISGGFDFVLAEIGAIPSA